MDVSVVALTGLAVSHEVFPSRAGIWGFWHGLGRRPVRHMDLGRRDNLRCRTVPFWLVGTGCLLTVRWNGELPA